MKHDTAMSSYQPVPCPCCGQVVGVPMLDIIIDHYQIAPMPARILRAIWNGKGHPVKSERIFDVMYEDDPDGGPHHAQMYNALKIGIWRLREKLEGSGISIESAGYGLGYRLKIGE